MSTEIAAAPLFLSARRASALSVVVAGVLLLAGSVGAGAALVDGYVRPASGLAAAHGPSALVADRR